MKIKHIYPEPLLYSISEKQREKLKISASRGGKKTAQIRSTIKHLKAIGWLGNYGKTLSVILIASILITGCGRITRMVAGVTGYSTLCVNNVLYIQFTSGASVAYNSDGKIATCK